MSTFQYHADILARYPSIVGGVILAQDMTNNPTPESLQTAYLAEQKSILQRIGDTPLSQISSLAAWRNVFRSFGIEPTQYRSAAEALLRRLTKKGDIPNINTLVDIGNLVSIRYALPVAVLVLAMLSLAIPRYTVGVHQRQGGRLERPRRLVNAFCPENKPFFQRGAKSGCGD